MKPKAFLFLGLLFAFVLISSVVVADTSQVDNGEKETNQGDGGKYCKWKGGCYRYNNHGIGCLECCQSAHNFKFKSDAATGKPVETAVNEAKEHNQQWGGGKSCRWQGGCCRWSPKGYGCLQCCHSVADATAVESHNGGAKGSNKGGSGGGWGGGSGGGGRGGGGSGHNGGGGGGGGNNGGGEGGGGGGSGWGGGQRGSQGSGKGGGGNQHGTGKGGDGRSHQGGGDHKGGGGGGGGGGH